MRTFGRRREKSWKRLAQRLGGEFIDGGFYLEDQVVVGQHTIFQPYLQLFS